jgi:YVTN family beta-propeller protein
VHLFDVPVGVDPVSVRCRTSNEVWVVNHISDSVSIVRLSTRNVVATISSGRRAGGRRLRRARPQRA